MHAAAEARLHGERDLQKILRAYTLETKSLSSRTHGSPPTDHPVMTWKQFFVHMAIVVLGLLVAIGLEQSVEALHHRHQRKELREALHRDLEKIENDSEQMFRIASHDDMEIHLNMHIAIAAVQDHVPFHADYTRLTIEASPIDDPAFKAARSSGLLAMLTQEEVRAYSEIDAIVGNAEKIDEESF